MVIYEDHLIRLGKHGAGDYHERDTRRYVGGFVGAFPGPIGPLQPPQIYVYLRGLGAVCWRRES